MLWSVKRAVLPLVAGQILGYRLAAAWLLLGWVNVWIPDSVPPSFPGPFVISSDTISAASANRLYYIPQWLGAVLVAQMQTSSQTCTLHELSLQIK